MLARGIFVLFAIYHVRYVSAVSVAYQADAADWEVRELSIIEGTSHPDCILLSLRHKSVKVVLTLKRSKHSNENVAVLVGQNRKITTWDAKPFQKYATYQDKHNQAYFLRATNGKSRHVYQGRFHSGEKDYFVKPVEISQQHSPKLRRRRQVSSYNESTSAAVKNLVPGVPFVYMPDAMSSQYVVEVFMVIDYAIYQSWYDVSLERTSVAKMNDAINSIRLYYTQVANGVDLRYSSIQHNDFTINVRLAGMFIATTSSDSGFTSSPAVTTVHNGNTYTIAQKALDATVAWSRNISLPQHDQITVFTGNILMGTVDDKGKPIGIAGLSYIGAICTLRSVAMCQEWNYYSSVGTATHELGHSLGAIHDGSNNSCSSTDQYIMAIAPSELKTENFVHPFNFSNCSITSIRNLLENLDVKSNCLLNTAVTANSSTWLVGQHVGLDEQCQLLYGVTSFYCGGADNDATVCYKMRCYNTASNNCDYKTEQRAADYTSCGDRRWCYRGSCVFNQAAPAVPRRCLSGDYKGPLSDGSYCQTSISSHPGLCYQSNYNSTCCSSCEKFSNIGAPDCLYGDKNDANYCSAITAEKCYDQNARTSCCATCKQYQSNLNVPGCPYGDKASWCSTTEKASCYLASISETCCATCYFYSQTGSPGCEYGDKQSWCSSYTSSSCAEIENANETCCQTCGLQYYASISSDCKDSFAYCSSIVPRHCYLLDQKCCRTCTKYRYNIAGCQYGDRYSWCNKTVEPEYCEDSTVLDDCCETCYRLRGVTRKPRSHGSATLPNVLLFVLMLSYLFFILS